MSYTPVRRWSSLSAKRSIARIVYWLKGLRETPQDLFCELGVEPTDHVLEIGCALGYHTTALAIIVNQGKLYAVDVWREGIEHTRSRLRSVSNVGLFCLSAEDVPLSASSLDKIVCFDTLHALPDPRIAVLQWIRWLRPGGRILYRDPEILATDILRHAAGSLTHLGQIRGVDVFTSSAR